MLVALGLLAAVAYGSADFAGGLAARRAPAVAVVLWSQLVGLAVLAGALALAPPASLRAADLAWGAAAGLFGGTGMALLYAGLASGVVSVVAPVTAVTAAVVPVVGGLLLGELISGPAVLGVLVGAAAVGLLSFAPGSVLPEEPPRAWVAAGGRRPAPVPPGRRVRRAALLALGAGTSFGAFFLLVDRTGEAAGFWPLAAARATSIPLMAVAALVLGRSLRLAERSTWRLVVVAGALDMVANLSFLLATRRGAVGVVAVLVALAPAATLALARLVLHERVRRLQAAGLALAGLAVVLIAVA